MLEDDYDRIRRFKQTMSSQAIELVVSRTAPNFIDTFAQLLVSPGSERIKLICLDHDLFVDNEGDPDPGDGRDVAAFLATQTPIAPVLIHSTNAIAADSMFFTLEEAGWNVDRIAPIGEDWIESHWYPTAKEKLLGDSNGTTNIAN